MKNYFSYLWGVIAEAHSHTAAFVQARFWWLMLVSVLILAAQWFFFDIDPPSKVTAVTLLAVGVGSYLLTFIFNYAGVHYLRFQRAQTLAEQVSPKVCVGPLRIHEGLHKDMNQVVTVKYVQLALKNEGLTPVTVRTYVTRSECLIGDEWQTVAADHEVQLTPSMSQNATVELDHDVTRHINIMARSKIANRLHFEPQVPRALHREFRDFGTYRLTVAVAVAGQASQQVRIVIEHPIAWEKFAAEIDDA